MSKLSIVGAMIVAGLAVGVAEADPPVYREGFRGDPNIQWPYASKYSADAAGEDCFSNCGGGCNDSPNPCGGPQQYWIQEMLDEPQFSRVEYEATSVCNRRGRLYIYNALVYTAPMRETYHGFHTAACQLHDNTCGPGIQIPGCVVFIPPLCDVDREERSWSYTASREGRRYELADVVEDGCTPDCNDGPGPRCN